MAINATAQWDVRTGGVDTNGGGFDPGVGSPGTDYSQQNSPQVAFTDLVIGATNTQLTSVGNPFSSADVGNIINITSGSGFTTGRYTVASVSGVTATMDRAVGTALSTGGHGNLGGSLLTPNQALNVAAVSGNTVWIQSGTYTSSSTINVNGTNLLYGNVTGYNATHGDGGTAPLITTATNVALITFINTGGGSIVFMNLSFSTTASTKNIGMLSNDGTGFNLQVVKCTFNGFSNAINGDFVGLDYYFASIIAINCVFENTTSHAIIETSSTAGVTAKYCLFKTIGGDGIQVGTSVPVIAIRNIFTTVSGRGIAATGTVKYQNTIEGNDFYDVTGDAVLLTTLSSVQQCAVDIENNIFYGNGASAVAVTTPNGQAVYGQNNAYGSNGTANVNFPAKAGDVTLTGNPWTSSSDFALNATSGAGAACKGAGFPGVFAGGSGTGSLDIGAIQSAGSGGGGNPVPVAQNLAGGIFGVSYSETISAQGGTSPYTFAVTSGALPTGLSLSSGGSITGTPSATGTFTFTVTVTDSLSQVGSQAFQIIISSPSAGGGYSYTFIG